jgi:dTDP-3-amino-3,4,6-trideoxy-alpha-D-glucose transaminase
VNGSAIKQWSDSGLVVIEDCAQSHLARSEGELVGRNSLACAFSFYPGKNLGALGDGGAVLSDDPAFLETIKSLRDHGSLTKYHHDLIGTTSRLDSIQAAVLSVKLEFLSNWNERRRTLAESYREQLSTIDGVRLVPWNEGDVHHLFVVRVDSGKRDLIRQRLSERQIESGIHYPFALSQLPAMRPWARPCPVAENAASELISLPMDPLMSEGDIGRVCRALEQSIAN